MRIFKAKHNLERATMPLIRFFTHNWFDVTSTSAERFFFPVQLRHMKIR